MASLVLGFAKNTDGGRQGLIEFCRWLRGDDPKLVHAFLVVGDYVIHRTFDGVSVEPLSKHADMIEASMENLIIAEADVDAHTLVTRAIPYTEKIGPMSFLDAFRWYFRLPLNGVNCLSFLYQFLGGSANDHVEPADLIRQFLEAVATYDGMLLSAELTLSYEVLRDAGLMPGGGYYVNEA